MQLAIFRPTITLSRNSSHPEANHVIDEKDNPVFPTGNDFDNTRFL
jgi:hypothetical protein